MKRNKKENPIVVILIAVLLLIIIVAICHLSERFRGNLKLYEGNKDTFFSVSVDGRIVESYTYNGVVYLFLPSYVTSDIMFLDDSVSGLMINGIEVKTLWHFIYDLEYEFAYEINGDVYQGKLLIKKSSDINTIYIDTQSGSMEQVWEDKDYVEPGQIYIYDEKGNTIYTGDLEYIKGRGNTTWLSSDKRPYRIKLGSKAALFGMKNEDDWILLANAYDGSKISNMLALDMAGGFGLSTTPKVTWVDLYLNGEYAGNYLLSEALDFELVRGNNQDLEKITSQINGDLKLYNQFQNENYKGVEGLKNPEDISGPYLVERDMQGYYEEEISGFITEDGNCWSLKYPKYASKEQVEYIMEYVSSVENMLKTGDDAVFDYLDLDTAVMRYFVDSITGNVDMGISSMYFYKLQGSDKLYSGPVWDYDRCFGFVGWEVYSSQTEVIDFREHEMISWQRYFEENEEFQEYCALKYEEIVRPYIMDLLTAKLDDYVEQVEKSVMMDEIVWKTNRNYYDSWEANVSYIRYYLSRRMEYFDKKYGVDGDGYTFSGNGNKHRVTVIYSGQETDYYVENGTLFTIPQVLDKTTYEGWYINTKNMPYNDEMPVLEDMTIEAYLLDW